MLGYSSIRIAVADDDEAVRDAFAALIEAYDFDVRAFSSGTDLLRAHAAQPAHCLVIDHQMPGLNGLDVLQTLRDNGDATPVILIAGMPNKAVHAKARSLGALAVLYKPVSHAQLMVAVQQAVASGKR